MKSPEKMVTIAENMSKVKASGLKDAIAGDIKTTANVRIPNASIKSKLQSVADGVKNTYESGVASAEKYKRNISGSTIAVNDVNPIEHDLDVGVRSKNLIPFPYIQAAKELNGIIVTANDNGSVGVSGTATADATIYFDLCVKDFGAINMYSGYVYDNGYVIKDCNYDAKNKKTFIVISVKSGVTVDKIYYPQIELGSTATPYTPYRTEFEGVEVSRLGKNLLDISKIPTNSANKVVNNGDGSLFIGIGNVPSGKTLKQICPLLKVGDVATFNIRIVNAIEDTNVTTGRGKPYIYLVGENNSWEKGQTKTVTQAMLDSKVQLYCRTYTSNKEEQALASTGTISELQIQLGSSYTGYEPYKEPQTATANADGVVEGLTSLSPNMALIADTEGVIIDCEYYSNTSN